MAKSEAESLDQGLEPHVIGYVEGELRGLVARKRHLEWLKRCIATEQSGSHLLEGGRASGRTGNPTLGRVLALEQDDTVRSLEARVRRVEQALAVLTDLEQQVITALYLERRLTVSGLALAMGYSEGHIRRVKRYALWQLALALGVDS